MLQVTRYGAGLGWFLADVGLIHVGYMDGRAGRNEQLAYLDRLCHVIDHAHKTGLHRGVLYYCPSPMGMDPLTRKQFGQILQQKEHALRSITRCYSLVTPSPLVRGLLTAVFWIAPPPYVYKIQPTVRSALEWISEQDPRVDVASHAVAYEGLVAELAGSQQSAAASA